MSRPKRSPSCHPDRPHKSLGLCARCWWKQYRGRPEAHPFIEEMVEELDFQMATWNDLERRYERPRNRLAEYLTRAGRKDLRSRVHRATYGTDDPQEIRLMRRRKQ